ncbi:MAG: ferritin family protein [Candidatus Odinarchaeota archaeon]
MDRDELIKNLESHIKIEETAVELYKEAMDIVDHFAFRLIFEELMMDSTKHKRVFEAIKKALVETPPSEWDLLLSHKIGKYVVPLELERHIELEEGMITSLKKEIKMLGKGVVRRLLEHILEDEQRHHSTLKQLITKI